MAAQPEPWLRGTIEGLHPAASHLLYTFEQAREELSQYCTGISFEQLWQKPHANVAPLGFQFRHIAGSVDRLTTYLRGGQLSDEQIAVLHREQHPGPTFAELMEALEAQFDSTAELVRSIAPETYKDPRAVGRRQLPTSVGGLIVHISEHTQRHLGQAVLIAKLIKAG